MCRVLQRLVTQNLLLAVTTAAFGPSVGKLSTALLQHLHGVEGAKRTFSLPFAVALTQSTWQRDDKAGFECCGFEV